jgi:serine protease Do
VIVTFNGKEIKEMSELPYVVASTPVGKSANVEVLRKGQKKTFEVKIAELKDDKEAPVVTEVKPRLGMTVEDLTPELAKSFGLTDTKGVVVVQVEDGSSAAEAGLRAGDVILEIDQTPVKDVNDFGRKIESYKAEDTVLMLAKRRGATVFLTLKVEGGATRVGDETMSDEQWNRETDEGVGVTGIFPASRGRGLDVFSRIGRLLSVGDRVTVERQ